MNRRSFFGRLGAGAVAAAAVPIVNLAGQERLTIPEPKVDKAPTDGTYSIPERPMLAESEAPADKLLKLKIARGLVKPCPNCKATDWKWWGEFGTESIECSCCGWIQKSRGTIERCPCAECNRGEMWPKPGPSAPIEESQLETAPVGSYIVRRRGQEITRQTLNERDWATDDWWHHVTHRKIARVRCGVRLLERHDNGVLGRGIETRIRANGDEVVTGWEIVDCDEWREHGRPYWAL